MRARVRSRLRGPRTVDLRQPRIAQSLPPFPRSSPAAAGESARWRGRARRHRRPPASSGATGASARSWPAVEGVGGGSASAIRKNEQMCGPNLDVGLSGHRVIVMLASREGATLASRPGDPPSLDSASRLLRASLSRAVHLAEGPESRGLSGLGYDTPTAMAKAITATDTVTVLRASVPSRGTPLRRRKCGESRLSAGLPPPKA